MIAPLIGSEAWNLELAEVGLSRTAVEALLAHTFGGRDPGELSAEELEACGVDARFTLEMEGAEGRFAAALRQTGALTPAAGLRAGPAFVLTAAGELLLELRCPRSDVRWHLAGLGLGAMPLDEPALWRWYARQLAALVVHGDAALRTEVTERFQYDTSLNTTAIADALFPWLVEALPESLHPWLLGVSGAVSWAVKGARCERLMPVVFSAAPAPELRSAAWAAELPLVGISEEEVDAHYHDLFADRSPETISNLDLFHDEVPAYRGAGGRLDSLLQRRGAYGRFCDSESSPARVALAAAVLFVAFSRAPQHACLDYLRVCAWEPPHAHAPLLRRWLSRQLAGCLRREWSDEDGPTPHVVEQLVDQFLGYTSIDPVLFPWLVIDVPVELHPALLAASATVAWSGKRDFYGRFVRRPDDHARLADALLRSCTSGVFHSIDAREGLALLEQLHTLDEARRRQLHAALTGPLYASVVAVAEPAEAEEKFRADHLGQCLAAIAFGAELPMWLLDGDLYLDQERVTRIATWYHGPWPEGPTTGREGLQRDGGARPLQLSRRHDEAAAAPASSKGLAWHVLDLPYARALALVGRRVEFRPRRS